jgi:two-component system, cell cycle sensor histidine kinase and response regulator CckA
MPVDAAENEARFRALIESSDDVTAIVDAELRVLYVSPSVRRILGYAPDDVVGSASLGFVHPEDAHVVAELFEDATARELRVFHADGSLRIMDAVGRNMLDDPAVRGLVVTARDVTARRALEDRLREVARLQAVAELAGGVAHDFNNILLVIRGYSSVLRSALDDPQVVADVDEIASAADRAAELTRRLLAFGRRQVLQPQLLDLVEVVSGIEELLRRTLPPGIELALDLPDGGVEAVADRAQLEESIFNLVSNARDAMPSGGTLTLAIRELAATGAEQGIAPPLAPGAYAAVTVADTGTGIAPDVLPRIFEPFFTTKQNGIGTGLGLSTVYGVAAQTGGGVGVAARDPGTAFTLYLPAAGVTIEDERWREAGGESLPGGTETILLVEDEEPVRELVRRVLEGAGYAVLAASLPSEAERLLDEAPSVDLLLTDVVMPEMSGYDLAARVRERRPDVRRLFISGYAPSPAGARAGRLLKKPFAPEQLARAVRAVLDDDGRREIA